MHYFRGVRRSEIFFTGVAPAVATVNVAAAADVVAVINVAAVALMTNQLSTRVGFMKENQKIFLLSCGMQMK